MKDDGGRVVKLVACNIMQLSAVEIDLQGKDLVIISGKNDAGKSTVLDLLAMVTGGAALCPKEPISRGKRDGFAEVEMVGYTARREFWLTKRDELVSKLILRSKEGAEYKSPQSMLDRILGPLTIDPLAFTRKMLKEPKRARDILLKLAGVDINLDELARARQNLYDERTRVNRNIKDKNGELAGIGLPNPDLLIDEVSLTAITREYQEAIKEQDHNKQLRKSLVGFIQKTGQISEEISGLKEKIKGLEGNLAFYQDKQQDADNQVKKIVDQNPDGIALRLAEAEETNRKIRAAHTLKENRLTLENTIGSLTDDSDELSHGISEFDTQKDGALQGAKFPVEGLSVDENGIRLNDFPLAQASQSEGILIGLAISTKMNPKASLIRIYDGSELDSDNRKVIGEFARENGLKILMEVVDETGNAGIVIEDGMVAKVN